MAKRALARIFVVSLTLALVSGCAAKPNASAPVRGKSVPVTAPSANNKSTIPPVHRAINRGTCRNAMKPLTIKTYDGSGQAMHPKVLYFDNGWSGWKYWMSYTPYPGGNAAYENPSIAVSNDGLRWSVPADLKNPISGIPADVARGGHYSDPHLVMNGQTMQLWFRYNPSRADGKGTSHTESCIYLTSSDNGTVWSQPTLVLKSSSALFSPAILYEGGVYKMWYSDNDGRLHYIESSDAATWSEPQTVNLTLPGHNIWHQDVIHDQGVYKIVFSSFKKGQFSKNNQCLYYATSPDGINFSAPTLALSPSVGENRLDNQMIYRSSLVDVDGSDRLYYSGMSRNTVWHIFETPFQAAQGMAS